MKVLVIGDLHGTKNWKRFDFSKYDKICFMGDYFDDWANNWEECDQIKNLEEILNLQRKDHNKFVVLMGNHDIGYLCGSRHSGKQYNKLPDIKEFLEEHYNEFRVVYQIGDYLFSHAGVSSVWCEDWGISSVEQINEMFYDEKELKPFSFFPYDMSMCGENLHQSLVWIRPTSLAGNPWKNYNQIVGHTSNNGENGVAKIEMANGQELIVVDNREHTAFYELTIEE